MKSKLVFRCLLIACLAALGGCMERDLYKGVERPNNKEFNEFDFSTVAPATSLEVDYLDCGVQAAVYFELYDEMPVTRGEYGFSKRADVTPLFAAYTDKQGSFRGALALPAYLDKVYVYTPAFYARTLIEAKLENGVIRVTDVTEEADTRVYSTQTAYHSYVDDAYATSKDTPSAYKNDKWKTWLGTYDQYKNGEVGYKYTGTELALENASELYTQHASILKTDIEFVCPTEYRRYTDLYVNEDAELAVTFLGQNTCWNCSLGYYYYEDGKAPTSLTAANVIMLFPNTQDGKWTNQPTKAAVTAGIDRGTAVQLMYYPNIASGSKAGETPIFPAGTRIGFVLANNAWSNRVSGFNSDKIYRAATSEGLSVKNDGTAYGEPRTAAYKDANTEQVMISFEDHTDDNNFSDVVIAMKSNPIKAITDVPVVDPESNRTTATVLKGIYAFEDMWPEQGDYDINDVLVRVDYTKTFDTNNKIYKEAFTLKTFQNFASLQNGLAFVLETAGAANAMTYEHRANGEKDFSAVDFKFEDGVYLLTEDVRSEMGTEYRVTIEYDNPVTKESAVKPFIFRNGENGKRWEVHICGEKPTSKMDTEYFGTGADASKPESGIYYVRSGNYPFAFFLSGANENNLSRLLDSKNEAVSIDELYPDYNTWVNSNGELAKDWYK